MGNGYGDRMTIPEKGYIARRNPGEGGSLTRYLPGIGTTGRLSFPPSDTDCTPKK